MAPIVNWLTKVITIPRSDLNFVSGTLYECDTDKLRLDLKHIEESSEGIAFERITKHNTEVTILGTTFARVIEVVNGYSLTFEDSPYTVKLVGSNNNYFDVEGGILNRNQVQVVSTNSAGLIASAADRKISEDTNYADGIYLNVNLSRTGTAYPNGTRTYPVGNLADALAISDIRSQSTIQIAGTLVLDQDVSGKEFISWKNGKVDLNNQPCLATRFKELKVYGEQSVGSLILCYDCRITSITGFNGNLIRCYLLDTVPITIAEDAICLLSDCRSQVPGSDSPILDFAAGGIKFNCRAYSGGIRIINSTDANNISTFEFIAGKFNFGTSNTAGDFHVRGVIDTTGIDAATTANVVTYGISATPETVWSYDR